MTVMVLQGDAIDRLRELPADSVHCCITSPPYWRLRDYGTGTWEGGEAGCEHRQPGTKTGAATTLRMDGRAHVGPYEGERALTVGYPFRDVCGKCGARRIDQQIGLEPTPEAWAAKLVEVFREVRRVLRPDGVCFVNIGDSYASTPTGSLGSKITLEGGRDNQAAALGRPNKSRLSGLKPKDLIGQPWLLAFALRADGWWLRSEIIWAKPNPMPESVTDRPTKAHEQVFLLTKSGEPTFWLHRDLPGVRSRPEPDYRWVHKETGEEVAEDPGDPENWKRINLWRGGAYFYDSEAVREANTSADWYERHKATIDAWAARYGDGGTPGGGGNTGLSTNRYNPAGRNLRSVWQIATEPFPEAHFATFPAELARRCILAGTSAKGCCPACGAPWARVVERGDLVARSAGDGRGYELPKAKAANGDARCKGRSEGWTPNHRRETETTGWCPSCACDAGEPVPCTVMDPFGGSGTTGLVADQLGRDAILIELSPDYAAMAERRLAKAHARRLLGPDAPRHEPLPGQLGLAL